MNLSDYAKILAERKVKPEEVDGCIAELKKATPKEAVKFLSVNAVDGDRQEHIEKELAGGKHTEFMRTMLIEGMGYSEEYVDESIKKLKDIVDKNA